MANLFILGGGADRKLIKCLKCGEEVELLDHILNCGYDEEIVTNILFNGEGSCGLISQRCPVYVRVCELYVIERHFQRRAIQTIHSSAS